MTRAEVKAELLFAIEKRIIDLEIKLKMYDIQIADTKNSIEIVQNMKLEPTISEMTNDYIIAKNLKIG